MASYVMHNKDTAPAIVDVLIRPQHGPGEAGQERLYLNEKDCARVSSMPEGPRRVQFLAGRRLIRDVLGNSALQRLAAEPGQRPVIQDGPPISLSHCPSHVALAVAQEG